MINLALHELKNPLLKPNMPIAASQSLNRVNYIFPGRGKPTIYEYDQDYYFIVPRVGEIVIADNDDGVPIQEWEVSKVTHQTVITEVNGIVTDIRLYLKKPAK